MIIAKIVIHHLRSQWSAMRAARKAPGTAASAITEDHARECTREKPCATNNVGTHEVKPYNPSVWHVHVRMSVSVRGRYGFAKSSAYPPRREEGVADSTTGGKGPVSAWTPRSIRSRAASASA